MNTFEFLGGDTIKIIGRFRDFNNTLTDPVEPKLKIYDSKYNIIHTILAEDIQKESEGVYSTIYTLPEVTRTIGLILEWFGLVNEKPSLERVRISVSFI